MSKKWELYDTSGGSIKRKRKPCPKCGQGVYLAQHKDRLSCGKCGYTEFTRTQTKQGGEPVKTEEKPSGEKIEEKQGKTEEKTRPEKKPKETPKDKPKEKQKHPEKEEKPEETPKTT